MKNLITLITVTVVALTMVAASPVSAKPFWEELNPADPAVTVECDQQHPETCLEEGQEDIRETYETED